MHAACRMPGAYTFYIRKRKTVSQSFQFHKRKFTMNNFRCMIYQQQKKKIERKKEMEMDVIDIYISWKAYGECTWINALEHAIRIEKISQLGKGWLRWLHSIRDVGTKKNAFPFFDNNIMQYALLFVLCWPYGQCNFVQKFKILKALIKNEK